jgi:hypothetical protein
MNTEQKNTVDNNIQHNLHPCLQGTQIFSLPNINSCALELRQLISAPNDIYKELYLPTLHSFMEFCQAMPADMQNPIPYSLLKRRLELAIATLKLRRGQMLPQHSNSEAVAEQEPLWTYALFTVSLLIQINHIQSDRSIELYKNKHEKLGVWHPMVGSLYETGTYYRIIPKMPVLQVNVEILQTELLGKIIPGIGMRWLSACSGVFKLWLEAITGTIATNNALVRLIREAAQKIAFEWPEKPVSFEKPTLPAASETTGDNVLQMLMDWIAKQANTQNKAPDFLRLTTGMFITKTALSIFITQCSITLSLNALIKALDSALLKKEENPIFQYCSIRFENRQILEGIIIDQKNLNNTLKAYQIQTDFIPNKLLQEES